MPTMTYYEMATSIMLTYMQAQPAQRLDLVRECIDSNVDELDIGKMYKAIDALLIKLESLRGGMASQMALSRCMIASEAQLSLFRGTPGPKTLDPKALMFDADPS